MSEGWFNATDNPGTINVFKGVDLRVVVELDALEAHTKTSIQDYAINKQDVSNDLSKIGLSALTL